MPVKANPPTIDHNGLGCSIVFDDEPKPPPPHLGQLALDTLGVSELERYIEELRAEIDRIAAVIERKQGHRGLADSFFKT